MASEFIFHCIYKEYFAYRSFLVVIEYLTAARRYGCMDVCIYIGAYACTYTFKICNLNSVNIHMDTHAYIYFISFTYVYLYV